MSEELSTRALCDVPDVKPLIAGVRDKNVALEPKIRVEINAESVYIHDRAGREFKPRAANPQTRLFDLTREDVGERIVEIGDLASAAGLIVRIRDLAGALLETVGAASYVLLPRIRDPWEPFTEIWFPHAGIATPATLQRGSVLELVGSFGWPDVPDDLRRECARNVAAKVAATLPVTQTAEEESAPQPLRVSYRVTDKHGVPRVA